MGAILGSTAGAGAGVVLGGRKKGDKAATRADDLARQVQQQAVAEQQATETKFQISPEQQAIADRLKALSGLTGEQLFRQISPTAGTLADQIQQRLTASPEALFRGISPTAGSLADIIQRRLGMSPEALFRGISPLAGQYADITQQQLGAPQQIPFQSTYQPIPFQDVLGPELDIASQRIAGEANRRGILGSGLQLEQLGRTGVELAIREAGLRQQNAVYNQQLAFQQEQARQQNALYNQQLRQQAQAQAAGLVGVEQGLQADALSQGLGLTSAEEALRSDALAQAQGLTSQEQGLGQNALNQYIDYNTLLRNQQLGGVQQGLGVYEQGQAQRQQFDTASLTALQNRMEQARQRDQAIAQALGRAGASALAFIPGVGPFLSAGANVALSSFGPQATGGGNLPLFGNVSVLPNMGVAYSPSGANPLLEAWRARRSEGGGGFGGFYQPPQGAPTPINMQELSYLKRRSLPFGATNGLPW